MLFSTLGWGNEHVASAPIIHQVGGVEFFSQVVDMGAQQSLGIGVVGIDAVCAMNNIAAATHLAGLLRQIGEQGVFDRGEPHNIAFEENFVARVTDDQFANLYLLEGLLVGHGRDTEREHGTAAHCASSVGHIGSSNYRGLVGEGRD